MIRLNASSRIIYEEALSRGYKVVTFNDRHLLRIANERRWVYVRGSRTSMQSSVGKTIADYKWLTRRILEQEGIPMAKGSLVRNEAELSKLVAQISFPVVVKPKDQAQGRGVYVGIQTKEELFRICKRKIRKGLIVEEMLVGRDFRVLVINKRFFAASQRLPAFVEGDGNSSIKELVDKENSKPERGVGHTKSLTKISIDGLVVDYLKEQGMSLDTVPKSGKRVYLRKTAGLSTGGVGIDVTDEVGSENRKLFERVADVCDLTTIGIDTIAGTLREPLVKQKKAGILEVNASPGLRMHHFPYQGKTRSAASAILDMLFEEEK